MCEAIGSIKRRRRYTDSGGSSFETKDGIVDTKTTAIAKILVLKTTEAVNMETTTRKDNTTMAGKHRKNCTLISYTIN